MANVLHRRKFSTQPPWPGAVLARSNPIARGLTYAATGGSGHTAQATLANFSVGTVVTRASTPTGVADYFNATVCKSLRNERLGKSSLGTVIVRHRSTVLPPNSGTFCHVLASTTNTNSENGWMLMLGNGTGKALFHVHALSSSADAGIASAGPALNDGKIHTTIATWDFAAGGAIKLYVDGTLHASGTHPNAITVSTSIAMITAGALSNFWGWLNGYIEDLYLFDRILTAAEVASFHAAPYQLWERPGVWSPNTVSGSLASARPQIFIAT